MRRLPVRPSDRGRKRGPGRRTMRMDRKMNARDREPGKPRRTRKSAGPGRPSPVRSIRILERRFRFLTMSERSVGRGGPAVPHSATDFRRRRPAPASPERAFRVREAGLKAGRPSSFSRARRRVGQATYGELPPPLASCLHRPGRATARTGGGRARLSSRGRGPGRSGRPAIRPVGPGRTASRTGSARRSRRRAGRPRTRPPGECWRS